MFLQFDKGLSWAPVCGGSGMVLNHSEEVSSVPQGNTQVVFVGFKLRDLEFPFLTCAGLCGTANSWIESGIQRTSISLFDLFRK